MMSVDRLLLIIETKSEKALKGFKDIDKVMADLDKKVSMQQKNMNRGMKAMSSVLLGIGMSFLFTGMAIQRFSQSLLTSIFEVFLAVEGESSTANDAIGELLASIYFLAYSLGKAFEDTGVLQSWIDKINELIGWFNSLDDSTKSAFMNILFWAFIIGSVMMILGQICLGLIGIIILVSIIGSTFLGATFLELAVIILLVSGFLLILNSDLNAFWKVLLIVGIMIFLALISPFALFLGVIALVIAVVWKLSDYLGGFDLALLAIGVTILKVGAIILDALISPLKFFIDLINGVIIGLHAIGQAMDVKEIEMPSFSKGVDKMRDNILQMSEERRLAKLNAEQNAPASSTGTTNNITVMGSVISEKELGDIIKNNVSQMNNWTNGSPQT